MSCILVADDDGHIREVIRFTLQQAGHQVVEARDGQEAYRRVVAGGIDLCILDILMPEADGLDTCRRIRAHSRIPIIFVSSRDEELDRVLGLELGADDYLVKPFELDELAARIRALARRRGGRPTPLIEHGALTLDPASHEVTLAGTPLALSPREFALLHALLAEPGVPQSRAKLEEQVYGWGEELESNAVEVHIHALRRKLGAAWIANLRGVGWFVPREPPPA